MNSNKELVKHLINSGVLKTEKIISAFLEIDRIDFVKKEYKDLAYKDSALPIGFGQTISQPYTVAFMLELLQPEKGDIVLDIGSGSCWTTCLIRHITGENIDNKLSDTRRPTVGHPTSDIGSFSFRGKVFAIERIKEIFEFGYKNASKYFKCKKVASEKDLKEDYDIYLYLGDGSFGFPFVGDNFFDKILISASIKELEPVWKTQLKTYGKIVVPVEDAIYSFEKIKEDEFRTEKYSGFSFVPFVKN